ncbi:MAG: DUF2793 domain-containing protein [Rhizobiaceae bacterium]|jgi:hypothetical protein
MTATPSLELPHILPSQAQKHVTHNEALERLDVLTQAVALGRSATPPVDAKEGECWIVAAEGGGAFVGHDGHIARFRDGGWEFVAARAGWRVWLEDEALLLVHSGGDWRPAVGELPMLGIGMAADAGTRLAVASDASLFSHAGAGHQLKLDKAGSGDTASLLFQTDLSGRAEIGTVGSDALSMKVSTDGVTWRTALQVDPDSGRVAFPQGGVRELLAVPRRFYVRIDGDDGNDGLADSAGHAFATIQRAVDAALALDSGLNDIEILIAPGTYVGGVSVAGALPGRGNLILRGAGGTAADVVISAPGHAIALDNGARLDVHRLTITAGSRGIDVANHSRLRFADIDFDVCGVAHVFALDARVVAIGDYCITGDAPYHVIAQTRGHITLSFATITMPTTLNFSANFAFALTQAIIEAFSCTFVGSATGSRFYVGVAAIIYTAGGAGYLPGDSAGSVDSASFGAYI